MTTPRVDLLLNDPSAIQAVDASGMLAVVGTIGRQLQDGFQRGRTAEGLPSSEEIDSVVVCGMGGSGITGDVLRAVATGAVPVPVLTSKGYGLPSHCGPNTLVLAVSFSGNTEETLAAYREAVSRRCRVVAIASGGALRSAASQDDIAAVAIPSDVLAPRAALGFLVGAALGVIDRSDHRAEEIERACRTLDDLGARLGPARGAETNPAKELAAWVHGATPLVWGTEGIGEAAALRWKTQLNENAKAPAFWSELPEANHNEICAWQRGRQAAPMAGVFLEDPDQHPRVRRRIELTAREVERAGAPSFRIRARGESRLERVLSLVLLGDLVSVYLAVLEGVDPTPVEPIERFKAELD